MIHDFRRDGNFLGRRLVQAVLVGSAKPLEPYLAGSKKLSATNLEGIQLKADGAEDLTDFVVEKTGQTGVVGFAFGDEAEEHLVASVRGQ